MKNFIHNSHVTKKKKICEFLTTKQFMNCQNFNFQKIEAVNLRYFLIGKLKIWDELLQHFQASLLNLKKTLNSNKKKYFENFISCI